MSAPENPPAFPCEGEGFGNPNHHTPGMTLRDYYAGQALVGLLSGQYRDTGTYNQTELVAESFGIAEAMLLTRPPS